MKSLWTVVIAVSIALLETTAQAATLYTPPLPRPPVDVTCCRLVNVGKKPLDVVSELLDGLAVSATQTCNGLAVGNHCSACAAPDLGYCKFTVTGGGKKTVRGAIIAESDSFSAALPAQ